MAPCYCQLIGWAAHVITGSDSLLLSSEEPSRVKTRQHGPTNYQLTLVFILLPPILPPFCLCPTHTAVLQDGSCLLTKIATDLINSLLLIIMFAITGGLTVSVPTMIARHTDSVHQVQNVSSR